MMLYAADGAAQLASLPAARAAAAQLSAFAARFVAAGLLSSDSGASYFTYADAGLVPQAAGALSWDGTAMLVKYSTTEGYTVNNAYLEFLKDLRAELAAALASAGGALHGGVTGNLPISADSGASITVDIGQSDAVTVTLSFLLLALALRSIRLIALTFVALCAAFGSAFLLIWPLTGAMSTPNFVTSLVISTLVSLSLDYSLFLLSHLKARHDAARGMHAGLAPTGLTERATACRAVAAGLAARGAEHGGGSGGVTAVKRAHHPGFWCHSGGLLSRPGHPPRLHRARPRHCHHLRSRHVCPRQPQPHACAAAAFP